MPPPDDIPPRVLEQMQIEKLAAQYRAVFGKPPEAGQPETRSESQIAVWDDLQKAGYAQKPVFVPDRRTGELCPMRAAFADGRRSLYLYIESEVNYSPQIEQ